MNAQTLHTALKQARHTIYEGDFELNIVGIRSATTIPNSFDDTINVLYRRDGRWHMESWAATTDPGTYWLHNPMNAQGTAMLKAGQYVGSHAIGMHRGQYKALVNVAPVTVIRDADRDSTLDFKGGSEATGVFGINVHHASSNGTTKTVDKYSAGCQVFANIGDYDRFMALCELHRSNYGNRFTYTLIDHRAVAKARRRKWIYFGGIVLLAVIVFILIKRFKK
jgi:hypothetical protein